MKQPKPCQYPDCGQGRNGTRHYGPQADHEYQGEPRQAFGSQRQPLSPRSESPKRVERAQEVAQARSERREAVGHCEARAHGIVTPCGTGLEARLEASHVVGLGAGGGKEYGEIRMLCRRHHSEIDTNRAEMRAAGLSKRAPRPQKVVKRRWEDE